MLFINSIRSFLYGKKTYIISTLMIMISLVRLVNGDIDMSTFLNSPDLNLLLGGILGNTFRAAISK